MSSTYAVQSNSIQSNASNSCSTRGRGRGICTNHLAVREEGHIRDGIEGLRVAAAAVGHLPPQHGLGDVLRVVLLLAELALQVVDALLLLVAGHPRAALEALVAGSALRARLRALAARVLVAGRADGEGALVARYEGPPVEP